MKVLFTGGGSGGHILPNLAVIEALNAQQSAISNRQSASDEKTFENAGSSVEKGTEEDQSSIINHQSSILYVGLKGGMEEEMTAARGIPFSGIRAGKWRRYADWRNVSDIVWTIVGFFQSLQIVHRFQPDAVFAKGGFVSVPVVLAAWVLRKRIVTHESDTIPGLANRILSRFADTVCVTFPKEKYGKKEVWTGLPVRKAITGKCSMINDQLSMINSRPTLLVLGGSLGANEVNELIWEHLEESLKNFNIIHLTGKGRERLQIPNINHQNNLGVYEPYQFVGDEIVDLYKRADLVLTRAGATTIIECILMRKPMILMPLGKNASRGEQWANAEWVWKHGTTMNIFPPLPFLTPRSYKASVEHGENASNAYLVSDEDLINRFAQGTEKVMEELRVKSL